MGDILVAIFFAMVDDQRRRQGFIAGRTSVPRLGHNIDYLIPPCTLPPIDADRQSQHDIFGRNPSIFRDVTRESREASTDARPEAFAAAIAANQSNQNPEVAAETVAFLRKQTELLEVQRKSEVAELQFFGVEWRPRIIDIRLRTGFQIFFALFATVMAIGTFILIRDAVISRRVVIEPFEVPPALVARGLTGKVVASALLDELSGLQEATRSSSAARDLSGACASDIRLDEPETGLSIGEISRLLRERFGHDVHIDGDLFETATGGLTVTRNRKSAMALERARSLWGCVRNWFLGAARYVPVLKKETSHDSIDCHFPFARRFHRDGRTPRRSGNQYGERAARLVQGGLRVDAHR